MKVVFQRAALVVFGLLAAGVIAEIALRTWAPQAIYAVEDCYLGWCHVPDVAFVHGAETGEFVTHVRYNREGLRDREYPIEKPAGVRRVLVFGDSYAEALEVEAEETHAKRLERLLADCAADPIQVINFGVSAYDTAQEWWYFHTRGVLYRPDVVVVIWTGEEGSSLVTLVDGRPVFVELQFGRVERWRSQVRTFIKRHLHTASFLYRRLGINRTVGQFLAAKTGQTIDAIPRQIEGEGPRVPFTPAWAAQVAIMEDFVRVAAEHGAPVIWAANTTGRYRYLMRSLEVHPIPGLIVVDLQQGADPKAHHFPRDGHWNSKGHELAADVLFRLIRDRRLLGCAGRP